MEIFWKFQDKFPVSVAEGAWYVPYFKGQRILCRIFLPSQSTTSVSDRLNSQANLFDVTNTSVGLRDICNASERSADLFRLPNPQVLAQLGTVWRRLWLWLLSTKINMQKSKTRSFVLTDPLYSSGARLFLVLIALVTSGHFLYNEGMKILENWDDDLFWTRREQWIY